MPELLGIDFTQLHLLRPLALFGLVPALVLAGLAHWRKRSAGNWEKVINPQLLPYLMQGDETRNQHGIIWALLAWVITCVALAGPTWQQLPQPVHKQDSALILIMDLSPSMLAEDVKPSRLARARFKLIDILNTREEGFTALVVYAGEAYTLAPLTEDNNTIVSLVPVLHPTLLPEYGSNTEAAIETALELAVNGGYQQADLLLITDEVSRSAFARIQSMIARAGNFRLSILGVGTDQGAPIPTGAGGFAKDADGAIIIPKLSSASLAMLAANNGGIYRGLSADDSDIEALLDATDTLFPDATKELERAFDLWDDQGYWLIFVLLPALLLSFRKGNIAVVVFCAPLLFSDPLTAQESTSGQKPMPDRGSSLAGDIWRGLWQTPDQQASDALQAGDPVTAQSLFQNPQWRASSAYQAGDYQAAVDDFIQFDSADGHYNRGNALAHTGDLDAAIEAYNQALKLDPDMEDAAANKALLEQLKQQQQQDSSQKQEQSDSSQQQQDSSQQQETDQQNQAQSDTSQSQQPADQPQKPPQQEQQSSGEQESQEQESQEQKPEQQESQEQKPEQQASETQNTLENAPESEQEKQAQQELEQWLRRVPDDPGGLLREKFRYQSRQRALERRRPAPPDDDQRQRW